MVTIKDVARLAGVSVTTVSKALSDRSDVSPVTKQRVRQIAEQQRYRPNSSAKRLVMRKSRRIALVIFGFGKASGEDNFVYELQLGMQQRCMQLDYEPLFLIGDIHYAEDEPDLIQRIIDLNDLAGLIVMGLSQQAKYYEGLKRVQKPTVCIDGALTGEHVGVVSVDNHLAACEAVNHLVCVRGRKRVLFINGQRDSFACKERLRGYLDAVGGADPADVVYGEYSESESYDLVKGIWLRNQGRYDAVFAASDMMAIGALRALTELGLTPGRDVDVIGFDNILIASYVQPPLTTVAQDKIRLGSESVQLLVDMIEGAPGRAVTVPHELIRRGTA